MTTKKETRKAKKTAPSATQEKRIIRRLSLISILGNTALTILKAAAGIFGRSGAMISDAIHSFTDVLTTVVAYFGVRLSKKAADKTHPYGYERLECVAALILGLALAATGLGVGYVGIRNIYTIAPETVATPHPIALIAAILSILSKEAMFRYTRYYAKKINSAAFMADAWHHRSDAFSSIGSLVGIGGAMLGFTVLDSVAGVVICLFILKVSYDILKNTVSNMLDTACDEGYERELMEWIIRQPEVAGVDMLHTRKFGNRVYVDLEIRVDGNKLLREGHAVAHQVHDSVEAVFPNIKHVMIHVNPVETEEE